MKASRAAGPSNPGSKEIPVPKDPNCLAGLSFVFTGELSSLAREEAVELAKRYGGYVAFYHLSQLSVLSLPLVLTGESSVSLPQRLPTSFLARTLAQAS